LFKWMGHARVALLDGDLRAWQAANYALSRGLAGTGTARSESRRVYGTPGHMPVIDVNELETGLADDSLLLLDARTPDRFAGKQEPLDRVAGHVPGIRITCGSMDFFTRGMHCAPNTSRTSVLDHHRSSFVCADQGSQPAIRCWPLNLPESRALRCTSVPGVIG
jgi:3-mercaptopyruvate sulfurtransferase SseA